MLPVADRTVRSAHHVANRQVDRLLLFTAVQTGAWYAHRRARSTIPRVVRGAAVSSGVAAVAAVGTVVVVRHRLGLHDGNRAL
jgi:hypothetical protein